MENSVIPCGGHSLYLCPWTGTREVRTIAKLLSGGQKEALDIISVSGSYYYLQITSRLDLREWTGRLQKMEIDLNDPDQVLPKGQAPRADKYDYMVPEDLLRQAFLYNKMDLPAAVRILKGLKLYI